MRIRVFAEGDEGEVVGLWERCGLLRSWNDPSRDIKRKLRVQRELFLVGELDGRLVAVVMAGYEGHRGWVNYLAVDPELQGRGLGRQMMAAVEGRLAQRGCPKVQLQIRRDNEAVIAFYRSLGYVEDEVVSMGKRLEFDDEPPAPEAGPGGSP